MAANNVAQPVFDAHLFPTRFGCFCFCVGSQIIDHKKDVSYIMATTGNRCVCQGVEVRRCAGMQFLTEPSGGVVQRYLDPARSQD